MLGVVCVGRDVGLALLHEQLEEASRGAPRIVWIEGEPGIGKTTLVRAFLARNTCQTAWAAGDEAETSLRFGLLASLNQSLAPNAPSQPTDPLAAGAELLVTLGGCDEPVVLVVDDLQWADPQSASALRFALRRLLAEPVLVILITRPDPGDLLGESWTHLLSDGTVVTRLHLDGLSAEGIADLVAARGHGQVSPSMAERLRAHTHGSPLHAAALVDELGDSVLRTGGVLPAPRSFASLTVGRLTGLGDDAIALVSAGSVLGMSFPLAQAAAVGGVAEPINALDRAVESGLLEESSDGEVRFTHPLVRGALYNDLAPSRLRELHQAASRETTGVRSLEHRVAATTGPDDELAREIERRAVKELLTGRGATAYDHFMTAARLSSDPAIRDRRTLIAIEALFSSGAFTRTFPLLPAVLACPESAHRSYVLGILDQSPGAADHFSAAAAAADERTDIPFLRLRAIGGRAVVHLRQGRFEAALEDAMTTLAPGGESWASGLMRWVQVVSLANLGRTTEARQVLELRPVQAGSFVDSDDLCARGLLELVDDDLTAAVADLTALAERARAGETCRLIDWGLSMLAVANYRLGRWDESAMHAALLVDLLGDVGRTWVVGGHAVATLVHAGRGRFEQAEADIRAAQEANRAVPTASGPYYIAMARAALAQAQGNVVDLRAATAPILEGQVRPVVEAFEPWAWQVMAIEGLLGTGELSEARQRLDELTAMVEARDLISPRTDMARLEGLLAEASDDTDAARTAYTDVHQTPVGRPALPLPAARLALAHGSLLRRSGSRRAAIEQLRIAHAGLTALGAAPFLAVCEAELSACGLRAAESGPGRGLQLTPTEETVAHLIMEGLTNREAATRLYVSAKAIDYHLGNIYRKLGISSRRDLNARLRPPPG